MIDVQKTKVILVGNSVFPRWGGEIKDIPNVGQNMDLLKTVFLDPKYFGIPNDPQHFVEIKDEVSQEILMRVKHETKSFADKDSFDRLIFYYSGHGIPGEDSVLFFASKDTVRSDYEITSVNSHQLLSYLDGFHAKELIVILDCCYAAQTKENQGDADSLISKNLPEDKTDLDDMENGIYYLFAAGKDNVAKFNPKEPQKPTYFTEALLNAISRGGAPGQDFLTIGEIYLQLRREIAELKKANDADIPEPRPVLHGNVSGFIFCKNIKFQNEEDIDFQALKNDPSRQKWVQFRTKYPLTRFDSDLDMLLQKMINGEKQLRVLNEEKDITVAIEIKANFKDIPYIVAKANEFINALAAKPLEETAPEKTQAAETGGNNAFNAFSGLNAGLAVNRDTESQAPEQTSLSNRMTTTARN